MEINTFVINLPNFDQGISEWVTFDICHFTTQCYIKGEPRNQKDFILKRVKDLKARESLIVPFKKVNGARTGEVAAKFDIVLGWTPES